MCVVILLAFTAFGSALSQAGYATSTSTETSSSSIATSALSVVPPPQSAGTIADSVKTVCNYTISLNGTTPIARSQSGAMAQDQQGADVGALVNGLLSPHEELCIGPGDFLVASEILVQHLVGVTLNLDPATFMNASGGYRAFARPFFRTSLLLVNASPDTVVRGGHWIGPGGGETSVIRIQTGSNDSVVEDADVSHAGWDGILIYDDTGPSFNVSVCNNLVHENGRYGVQEYANETTGFTGNVISGNDVLDNRVGGIYTNRVTGATVAQNVVRNTLGEGPGKIGIGVTNGGNDTVASNRVEQMGWFGIQAYYNNYTVISDNISILNSGSEDQSGITNDHSSFDKITNNDVEKNGRYGIYVERSWNVTISGNTADDNMGYGIELNHGSSRAMGKSNISSNSCSSNGLGGIILNSAIDNEVSMNTCDNNAGDGILLYNDDGQAGSTGNLVSDNFVGNVGGATPQAFGVVEANDSGNNTLLSNTLSGNAISGASLLGA